MCFRKHTTNTFARTASNLRPPGNMLPTRPSALRRFSLTRVSRRQTSVILIRSKRPAIWMRRAVNRGVRSMRVKFRPNWPKRAAEAPLREARKIAKVEHEREKQALKAAKRKRTCEEAKVPSRPKSAAKKSRRRSKSGEVRRSGEPGGCPARARTKLSGDGALAVSL